MAQITVIGVGFRRGQLTEEAQRALKGPGAVVLHTERCGLTEWLRENGVPYEALDALYEDAEDFDRHAEMAARAVLERAGAEPVRYAVFDVRDRSVAKLIELSDAPVGVIAGPPIEEGLWAYAGGATDCFEASDWENFTLHADRNAMVRELATRELASEVKLKLMDCYPTECLIHVRSGDGEMQKTSLVNLDRLPYYDHRVSILVPAERELTALERYGFDDFDRVIRRLRSPDGCPWDRKQTHRSLRTNLVEEAYEAVDAIDRGDTEALYDELGDVLLQIVLHAEIARQHGEFAIGDVITAIAHKMISRHPHVFSTASADTPDQVLSLWQKLKKKERHQDTQAEVLKSVTKSLPALMRAEKVQKRAADVGFDWKDAEECFFKISEEADELREAMERHGDVEGEAGDLLFAAVNVIRLLKLDPELLLNRATDKFIARFEAMEELILRDGKALAGMALAEMDAYWNRVKLSEKHLN
ncbi:MAG: nucleoside triphosphate pyrophosphohydrolase [Clostridiales bacterium]|jgi:tetrapyrrole methylase family protein/MazG family protein|nr:nucleoside triphosphate pyrophosphohydrolase [Clostridiales bacterium]